ncbi:hypothetical protein JCM11641_002439, partial [Rhodosporidiobolus odoratus]
ATSSSSVPPSLSHLVCQPSPTPSCPPSWPITSCAFHTHLLRSSLDAALLILPTTRSGLTLNPRFSAIDAFCGAGEAGELALFELAQIPLLHGWLADKQKAEEFEVMAGEKGCVDYDTALERLVEGTEIAGPLGLRLEIAEAEDVVLAGEVERRSKWSEEVQEKVRRGGPSSFA